MNITTSKEIALMSLEQIKSLRVSDLKDCCKLLGLRGYSKLTKPLLIETLFNASDVERQAIVATKEESVTATEKKAQQAKIERREKMLSQHPINVIAINTLRDKKKLEPSAIASILFKVCCQFYADITVAKECTKKLNLILPKTTLTQEEQKQIKETWGEQVYAMNFARKELEKTLLRSYALKAEKSINTEEVIDWAITNLYHKNRLIRGITLAILSGRRMVEIYGDTQYKLGDVGIIAEGVAKKSNAESDVCEFVPLCDRNEWLEALNGMEKRGYTKKQVNANISSEMSKKFPEDLKELGVEKFKDTRDVYAAIAYQTFQLVVRDAIPFTKKVMGHNSQESTSYYHKFDCKPLDSLKDEFKAFTRLV